MSTVAIVALVIAAVAVVGFAVAIWAACAHAAWLIQQERLARQIELEPTPNRTRLGIQTKTRPRRSHDRPHDH